MQRLLWRCALVLALVGGAAQAGSGPRALLARAKAAVGGAAWDRVTSIERRYTDTIDGRVLHGMELSEPMTGRHTTRLETVFAGFPFMSGWDGKRYWESHFAMSRYKVDPAQASNVFLKCMGHWYRRCGPARFNLAGRRVYAGAQYDVVRIEPAGVAAFEYWINRRSGRIERMTFGEAMRDSVDYADFRVVGGVRVAFQEHYVIVGAPSTDTRLERVTINATLPERAFDKPDDAPVTGLNGRPEGVPVPFTPCENHLCVQVMLNGRGPFRFALDTGAMNMIFPATAAKLGLTPSGNVTVFGLDDGTGAGGMVRMVRTELGALGQDDQAYVVVPLVSPGVDVPVDYPLDGVLGAQWMRQCITRIDWAAHRLTFYDPASYAYRGPAQATALDLSGNTPRVQASINGQPGWFYVDIGDWAGVTVNADFARSSGLADRYRDAPVMSYGGIGGEARAARAKTDSFELGGVRLGRAPLLLAKQSASILTTPGLAGNLGNGVLSRMDIVLDYPGQRAYFEPNASTAIDCDENCTIP